MSERLHVGLNLLHAHPTVGGAYNYAQSLVSSLAEHARDLRLTAFVSSETAPILEGIPGVERVTVPFNSLDRRRRIFFELTAMERLALRSGVDVLHWFANTCALGGRLPSVVTFHDMLAIQNPRDYSRSQRMYLNALIPRSANRCTLRLPVSQSTAHDMDGLFGSRPGRTNVVYFPLPDALFEDVPVTRNLDLPKRYWLYIAHFYPHKNHERLIRAYARLDPDLRPPILLRGDDKSEGTRCESLVKSLGLERCVVRVPRLPLNDLLELLRRAEALIFPSLAEGAGQPVMEALAAGIPVLGSDISTNREFLGDSPVPRFDPTSIESIAGHLTGLAEGRYDLESGIACGRLRVAQMRRSAVARQLAQCYHAAADLYGAPREN